MAFTTTFENFAKQQRESNPDITDEEIQQLWSQQPLGKRIASGIESTVMAPVTVPQPTVEQEKLPGAPEMQAPAAEPKTLTASLENKSTPEIKKTIKQSLKQADKAADNPPAGTSPQQVDKFKEQRDKAYELYDQAKSRNEWLELAQVLGQAATQYGAAQVGMRTGRNMAGLQIPGVDYGARTGQEQRMLESRLRDIGEAETREQRLKEREQERADTAGYRKAELTLKQQELKDKAEERAGRMSAEERQDRQIRAKSLVSDLDTKQKELRAAQQFANQLALEDDLSSKTVKKIEEKTPGLLGQAGIDPIDLKQIEQEATQRGYIWDTLDKEKKNELIQERIINPRKQSLNNIKAQLDRLSGGQKSAPSATMEPAATAPAARTVKIQAPDGSIAEVPAEKAQKYIDKGGKIVQ